MGLTNGFQKAIVVHPTLVRLITEHRNAPSSAECQLEDFPLIITDLTLLRADTAFLPDDYNLASTRNFKIADARNAAIMPVKFDTSFSSLGCAHGIGTGSSHLSRLRFLRFRARVGRDPQRCTVRVSGGQN